MDIIQQQIQHYGMCLRSGDVKMKKTIIFGLIFILFISSVLAAYGPGNAPAPTVTTTTTTSSSGGGGGSTPQCNDGRDNDLDGFIDYPNDPGCDSLTDTDETDLEACVEDWFCASWEPADCTDGKQTRECSDWNACGTTLLKPYLERNCIPAQPEQEKELQVIDVNPPVDEKITGGAVYNKEKILRLSLQAAIVVATLTLIGLVVYYEVTHRKHHKQAKKTKAEMIKKLKEKHK